MLHGRGAGRGTTLLNSPEQLAEIGFAVQERAGIMEYHGGLARDEADRLAWEEIGEAMAADDDRRASARGATEHWKPFKPDRDVLST